MTSVVATSGSTRIRANFRRLLVRRTWQRKKGMNPTDHANAGQIPAVAAGGANGSASQAPSEQCVAALMSENTEWLRAHEGEILSNHPDWADRYLAVASRTSSKILAAGDERSAVIETGLQAPELLELARREGLPPGVFLSALLLDVTSGIYDP